MTIRKNERLAFSDKIVVFPLLGTFSMNFSAAPIILPTLAKFQLVWRRLCDVVFPSTLCHSLAYAPLLVEYRS